MFRSVIPRNTAALLILAASMASVHADQRGTALAVVMTNDPQANQIKVYDTRTRPCSRPSPPKGRAASAVMREASSSSTVSSLPS